MEAKELILFFLGCLAGVALGLIIATSGHRSEAAERGYAEYDAATGQWGWKDK
jgi:hypothetical protein